MALFNVSDRINKVYVLTTNKWILEHLQQTINHRLTHYQAPYKLLRENSRALIFHVQ